MRKLPKVMVFIKKLLCYLVTAFFGLAAFGGLLASLTGPSDSANTSIWVMTGIFAMVAVAAWIAGKSAGTPRRHLASASVYTDADIELEEAIEADRENSPYYGMTAKDMLREHCRLKRLGKKEWHHDKATERQLSVLEDYGISYHKRITKGEASLIIDELFFDT